MNFGESILKLNNYVAAKSGQDAFEQDHQHCIVLFMTDGVYWYWTPEPRGDEDYYNYGVPDFVDEAGIDYSIDTHSYILPDLAKQVGAEKAWAFDL